MESEGRDIATRQWSKIAKSISHKEFFSEVVIQRLNECIRIFYNPRAQCTMMFANIMAQYGIAVGIAVVVLIVLVLMTIIIRSRHNSVKNRLMTTTSSLILIGILMINILENLRVLPPVTGVTFLPFVSTNPGDMIVSIGLLGIAVWCGLNSHKEGDISDC